MFFCLCPQILDHFRHVRPFFFSSKWSIYRRVVDAFSSLIYLRVQRLNLFKHQPPKTMFESNARARMLKMIFKSSMFFLSVSKILTSSDTCLFLLPQITQISPRPERTASDISLTSISQLCSNQQPPRPIFFSLPLFKTLAMRRNVPK
jgi:hypothetical protein